jgi:hypothetical protein
MAEPEPEVVAVPVHAPVPDDVAEIPPLCRHLSVTSTNKSDGSQCHHTELDHFVLGTLWRVYTSTIVSSTPAFSACF